MNKRERFIYYSSPEHWFQTALELNGTIQELFETRWRCYFIQNYHVDEVEVVKRPQNSRAIYLLMAYSLENLLKGLHVLRNSKLVFDGKLNSKIKTHNLNVLAKELKFRNSLIENDFQEYLSNLCVSTGRYPIGNNEQNILKQPNISENDNEIYNGLFKKYSNKLTTEFTKKGWNSGIVNDDLNTKPNQFKFVSKPFKSRLN